MSKSKHKNLKTFLKTYTAVSAEFIDEYYKFYEMAERADFGINIEDVFKYLDIKEKKEFIERFRANYRETIDYIRIFHNIKSVKEVRNADYFMNLDTFERICMMSKSKRANSIRDYFITLRKFIHYYQNHIADMIIDNAARLNGKCVYIIVANSEKSLYKFGKTENMRKRLRSYQTGRDKHPDIKYIMLVEDKDCVETCVKALLKNFQYRKDQEIYQIDFDTMRRAISKCAADQADFASIKKNPNLKSFLVFESDE